MPTATKLSPKKPARRRVTKILPAHGIKAAPRTPFTGLEHVLESVGCAKLSSKPVPPPAKSTTSELLKKVHAGDFAKHVDLGKVAAAVATRSSSRR